MSSENVYVTLLKHVNKVVWRPGDQSYILDDEEVNGS